MASETATKIPGEEMVELYVPRISGNNDPNELIVHNGKNWLLPRGKKSTVPKHVAEEYERSVRAQRKFSDVVYARTEQAKESALAAGIK